MAEDNNKPKATLIKHKKTEPQKPPQTQGQEEGASEKKKVVVVKKKRVVKKSPQGQRQAEEKQPSQKQAEPSAQESKPEAQQKVQQEEQSTQTQPASKQPAASETQQGQEKKDTRQKPRQAYIQRGPKAPSSSRHKGQAGGTAEQKDRKEAPRKKGNFTGQKPAYAKKGAPETARRGAPPQGKQPPAPDIPGKEEQKPGAKNKKTFKQKKKVDYPKKKEQAPEKDFQIKKKPREKTKAVPKKIDIMEVITVSELARKMNLKASELISKLMSMGMMVTINQQIDSETAELLASEYGCQVNIVSLYDETVIEKDEDSSEDASFRPPIVTVMGHVDHGKTKLLDAIRTSDVVAGEFGGITQHIGASTVTLPEGKVVFLDTPGHSAFTLMRSRGAQITDIVILVVAANDGVMPQTVEAINHAKAAEVPIIVAVNKVDLPEANPDRVKQQLSEYGLIPEAWGGQTLFCDISALKNQGIKELLDMILLQSEMLELSAEYDCRAEGRVIESKVEHGRGIVSTILIQRGTLRVGDPFVAGIYSGKVRAMFDDHGNKVQEATPSTPVEILGFGGIPTSGAPFQVTENEKQARQVAAKRQELERQGEANNVKKVTLDNLFDSIQEGDVQEFKVIIKGDVHGSVEALQTALEKLSTKEIKLTVIHASAGAIVENDINLAVASNAIVIGFNVRPTPKAQQLAEKEKIDIRKYNIIYDAVDDIKSAMEGMLSPDYKEEVIGRVEVRDVFKVPKIGVIAGCYVLEGKIRRNASTHVLRDETVIHTGKVSSLKRFKDDVRSVDAGYECGVGVEKFQSFNNGDILEVFEMVEVKKSL